MFNGLPYRTGGGVCSRPLLRHLQLPCLAVALLPPVVSRNAPRIRDKAHSTSSADTPAAVAHVKRGRIEDTLTIARIYLEELTIRWIVCLLGSVGLVLNHWGKNLEAAKGRKQGTKICPLFPRWFHLESAPENPFPKGTRSFVGSGRKARIWEMEFGEGTVARRRPDGHPGLSDLDLQRSQPKAGAHVVRNKSFTGLGFELPGSTDFHP